MSARGGLVHHPQHVFLPFNRVPASKIPPVGGASLGHGKSTSLQRLPDQAAHWRAQSGAGPTRGIVSPAAEPKLFFALAVGTVPRKDFVSKSRTAAGEGTILAVGRTAEGEYEFAGEGIRLQERGVPGDN